MNKIKTDNTQVIINMQNVIDEQQKQIDELNAKAAAIADAFDDVALGVISMGAFGVHCGLESYQRLRDVINNSPFQSLAEHDARVIETMLNALQDPNYPPMMYDRESMEEYASNIRKQGEE